MEKEFSSRVHLFGVPFITPELDDAGLDPYQARVYIAVCRRAFKTGKCWESIPNLAERLGICDRKVREVLQQLVARRMLRRIYRQGQPSIYQPTESTAWLPAPDKSPKSNVLPWEGNQ